MLHPHHVESKQPEEQIHLQPWPVFRNSHSASQNQSEQQTIRQQVKWFVVSLSNTQTVKPLHAWLFVDGPWPRLSPPSFWPRSRRTCTTLTTTTWWCTSTTSRGITRAAWAQGSRVRRSCSSPERACTPPCFPSRQDISRYWSSQFWVWCDLMWCDVMWCVQETKDEAGEECGACGQCDSCCDSCCCSFWAWILALLFAVFGFLGIN